MVFILFLRKKEDKILFVIDDYRKIRETTNKIFKSQNNLFIRTRTSKSNHLYNIKNRQRKCSYNNDNFIMKQIY